MDSVHLKQRIWNLKEHMGEESGVNITKLRFKMNEILKE